MTPTQTPNNDPFAGLESDDIGAGTTAASERLTRENYKGFSTGQYWEPCPKCAGSGSTRWGVCFKCQGKKGKAYKTAPETRAANRERAANSKEAKIEAFKTEYADVWAWMDGSSFPPAVQMLADLHKYGSLFDSRIEFARRMIQKRADAQVARAEIRTVALETAPVVGSALHAAFEAAKAAQAKMKASEKGGRKPVKLRFDGFVIFEAKKHPGTLYVKQGTAFEDTYFGKVVDGRFIRGRDCSDAVATQIADILKDPEAAAVAYGKRFGMCCICGAGLTNHASIDRGIGPICAEKMGW